MATSLVCYQSRACIMSRPTLTPAMNTLAFCRSRQILSWQWQRMAGLICWQNGWVSSFAAGTPGHHSTQRNYVCMSEGTSRGLQLLLQSIMHGRRHRGKADRRNQ